MKETGRQRATRVSLDYHRHRDDLWRRRMMAAAIALVLALAYVAFAELAPRGQISYSHGPLSHAHATWDADCQACHQDFQAIHSHAWFASDTSRKTLETRCTSCHAGAGHHTAMLNSTTAGAHQMCSACHREHRGRDQQLTLVKDAACTDCHGRLEVMRVPDAAVSSPSLITANVTAFAQGEHPDFRSLSNDPGNVRFNHALHLLPGINAPDSRAPGLSYGRIGEKYGDDQRERMREQYRTGDGADNELVQLTCASCHQLAPSDASQTNWHMARDRAFMEPVTYASHCKACHPLDYQVNQADVIAPHGITLAELRTFLVSTSDSQDSEEARSQSLDFAIEALQQKCAKCHEPETIAGPVHSVVAPPRTWFRHARFNHAAHIGAACTTCHSQSTEPAAGGAVNLLDGGTDQNYVMIKGIDVCLQCHEKSGSAPSIARSDCAECHRYHVDPLDDSDFGPSTSRLYEPLLPK